MDIYNFYWKCVAFYSESELGNAKNQINSTTDASNIDDSGNVRNIRKSPECLINFQLFLKALLSRTKTLDCNIIVNGRLV